MLNSKISNAVAGIAAAASLLPGCAEKPVSPSDNQAAAVSTDNGLSSMELPKIDRTQAKQLSAAEHIEGYMQEAKKLMKVIDPKLLNELNREGLTIKVVPNLDLAMREIMDEVQKETGKRLLTDGMVQPEDGVCFTPLRPMTKEETDAQLNALADKIEKSGGKGKVVIFGNSVSVDGKLIGSVHSHVAMDSHILLKQSIYDPKKSEVDNLAYGIAVFVHETYHLSDHKINPLKGNATTPPSRIYHTQDEISTYRKGIEFLEKVLEMAKEGGNKELVKALEKVIKHEQKYLDFYEGKK